MRRALLAAVAVALVTAATAAAFAPSDPFVPRQWYLEQDHAFDTWPDSPPALTPVRVAIVDSGVDGSLPDLAGRIVASKSFVGGSALVDEQGHGTFVAGVIAANHDGQGIAGMAPNAQLLIAKVAEQDGTIPLDAEVKGIRWAADHGAKVINLSLSGQRDPLHSAQDTYYPEEAAAVAYAYAKGAVVVAAIGNGDESPAEPWPYASYPAALPHVLGVGALTKTGNVPDFSNRDAIYNDISAPGSGIFSTFPSNLTALRPGCVDQGYSDCGPDEYRAGGEGTSFAVPQVAAAAAVLFGLVPTLTNGQVVSLLEHSADDVNAGTGCPRCALLRDPLSGWGRLNVAAAVAALAGPLPAADRFETNDEAGAAAHALWGTQQRVDATLDYYDDPVDVYRVVLRKHQKLKASVSASWTGATVQLELWRPGTKQVDRASTVKKYRAAAALSPAAAHRLAFTAPVQGAYYVEVKATSPGFGAYVLKLSKS
jgi:subtilisin family serine protease